MNGDQPCPCGGFRAASTYAQCCRPFIMDGELAPTCEQLMRSRYTAFVVEDADHLWRTWHPRTRPSGPDELGDLGGPRWCGLRIVETEAGGSGDKEGVVEFVAAFTGPDGTPQSLHERSSFARRAGRWFYVDGEELPVRPSGLC